MNTKDEGDRVIVFQGKRNDCGRFVVLSVTPRSSRGCHIIIPEDVRSSGWENFGKLLLREFVQKKEQIQGVNFNLRAQEFPSFGPNRFRPSSPPVQRKVTEKDQPPQNVWKRKG